MKAIEFNHVGKQYRLGVVSTGTFSHDLNRWWAMHVLGKEDPYLKIGATNVRSTKSDSDFVWALKDIDFSVEQGDVVGIIGKNGAGKSTLLKLLSRVTAPTLGEINVCGRIASLLEVGTGFHPEMTGRENIYMNGAIMGMTKAEIARKFDEIVDFSGCERYIDTPVKRYSSGMKVRLGFAVAAHLEPEILVVDEVLAVGDAEFQKKAIGKMQDVAKGQGRTVLFVSHNMAAVKSLCKHGVLLENGIIKEFGFIDDIVTKYLQGDNVVSNHKIAETPIFSYHDFQLYEIGVHKKGAGFEDTMRVDDELELYLRFKMTKAQTLFPRFHFKNEQGTKIFSSKGDGDYYKPFHEVGIYEQLISIPANFLNWGTFYIDLILSTGQKTIYTESDVISFTLSNKEIPIGMWMGREPGDVTPQFLYHERILPD